ncbi:MAG: hypothetical protein V3W19_12905, partial [Desulfatiglandales bacterium]
LFSEGRKILHSLSNAPWALFRGASQAKKVTVAAEVLLWGCPVQNFRAKLPFGPELKAEGPFNGMRQGFATFRKEIPTALHALFQRAKIIQI